MAVEGVASTQHLEFLVSNLFIVQKLSHQVREKWREASTRSDDLCTCSLEEIAKRQRTAEENRLKQQESWRTRARAWKRPFQESHEEARQKKARELDEKLAFAEVKRQTSLEERRMKATTMLQRSLEAAERLIERQSERAARLDAKLEQAERVRELQIAAAAAKGGETAAHAKAVSVAARARGEAEAAKRRANLDLRLQRAGDARHELTQTVLASLAPRGAEPFLLRRALTRSILRRQSSARLLQRCWRDFERRNQTTSTLAKRFLATGIPQPAMGAAISSPLPPMPPHPYNSRSSSALSSPQQPATPANTPATRSLESSPAGSPTRRSPTPVAFLGVTTTLMNASSTEAVQDPFEHFAKALQSPATLQSATALLRRLAIKLGEARRATGVEALLQRLFPKARRPERYPARVFLSSFMILKHPKVVFNQRGEREEVLGCVAAEMVAAFEKLLHRLVEPVILNPRGGRSRQSISGSSTVANLLTTFDRAWLGYLEQFVAWKLADAASLEAELVRVAVEMEASKLAKLGPPGCTLPRLQSTADRQALVEQVESDHTLLRERILRLGGQPGITRLEAGLAAARAAAAAQAPHTATPPLSPGRSTQSSPRGPATPARQAASAAPPSPASPGPSVTNESLAWELLYDLNFQLPMEDAEAAWRDATGETDILHEGLPALEGLTPLEAAAATSRRVRRIAEKAFWNSLAGSEPEQIAALLNELGMQLAEALPPRSRVTARVQEQFNPEHLREAITLSSVESLLPAFEQLATLLRELGSLARQEPTLAAHARIRDELAACSGDRQAISRALAKALRLMAAQLRLLQLDMSNATLHMLAGSLVGGEGIRYAQQKFADKHELQTDMSLPELASLVPHTRAWLAQASGLLPALQAAPSSTAAHVAQNASGNALPQSMRSGRGSGGSTVPACEAAPQKRPAAALVHNVAARSWRGLVRLGLVGLVTAEEQTYAPPPALAETLQLDLGRIHEAKEAFQQLLVLSACQLLVQQVSADRKVPLPDMVDLRTRLKAMLSDQTTNLASLAAELACTTAADGDIGQQEAALGAALKRMLARGSPGYKALSSGLTKVLQQLLLAGELPAAEVRAPLASIGAGSLTKEVQALADRLAAIAAVSEAVHADLYQKLASDLLLAAD